MSREVRKKIFGIVGMAAAAAVLIILAVLFRGKGKTSSRRQSFAMGSVVTITLYGDAKETEQIGEEIENRIKELDEEVISRRADNSELARWNREAKAGEEVKLSARLRQAVTLAIPIYEKSSGALDLTIRPVLDIWGIEDGTAETFQVPAEKELTEAAAHMGMDGIHVTDEGLVRDRKDITLDLGSVGKGYALDVVYDQEMPVTGGVIAVGGSIMVFGNKPDGGDFRVGIRDPEGLPEDTIGVITFPSGTKKMCISTSGGYEKFIEKDGVRYHHIIDPRTLRPSESGLKSVTVVCENGLVSDGLSTAIFILGEEEGKKLLSEFCAEGVFLRDDGSYYISDGIKDQVELR